MRKDSICKMMIFMANRGSSSINVVFDGDKDTVLGLQGLYELGQEELSKKTTKWGNESKCVPKDAYMHIQDTATMCPERVLQQGDIVQTITLSHTLGCECKISSTL